MHTFMDAKLMAKLLRQALAERQIEINHSDSLELVARQFGVANWNILSARIDAAAAPLHEGAPDGWLRSGKGAPYYRVGVEPGRGAWIESRHEIGDAIREDDFCTLMQSVNAAEFRGKRLRLATELKAEGVAGGVTTWFRIDGPNGSLRFENLERYQVGGPLRGSTDWHGRAIVLDVPAEATTLNYGFFLRGTGRGWARGFTLEAVGDEMPVNTPDGGTLERPRNLGFGA